MTNKIPQLKYFLTIGIWKNDYEGNNRWRRVMMTLLRKVYMAMRLFIERGHIDYATQLSFCTILAIIPIFAMIFGIGRGFGLSAYIEQWLRTGLSSQPQAAESIINLAGSYLQHAQTGVIIGVGIIFMLYSVLSLIYNIEYVFDNIWQVKSKRSAARIIADYTSMVFLVPIIIIIMSGLGIIANTTTDRLQEIFILGPIAQVLIKFLPFVALTMIFTGLFVVMPNTKVKFTAAIGPAILASVAMLLVQWGYVHGQMLITSYNAIYGSLAALPLLMLWMLISWYICLFCAELCYMNQYLDYYEFMVKPSDISEANRRKIALVVLGHISRRFREGRRPLSALELKRLTGIPIRIVGDALYRLASVRLISVVSDNRDDEPRYQPAQSVDRIRMGRAIAMLDNFCADKHKNKHINIHPELDKKTEKRIQEAYRDFIAKLDEITVNGSPLI